MPYVTNFSISIETVFFFKRKLQIFPNKVMVTSGSTSTLIMELSNITEKKIEGTCFEQKLMALQISIKFSIFRCATVLTKE